MAFNVRRTCCLGVALCVALAALHPTIGFAKDDAATTVALPEPVGVQTATFSAWNTRDPSTKEREIAILIAALETAWNDGYFTGRSDVERALTVSNSRDARVSPKTFLRVSKARPSQALNFSKSLGYYRRSIDQYYKSSVKHRNFAFWQILLCLSDGHRCS